MSDGIESRLKEDRRFVPATAFSDHAHVRSHADYEAMYEESLEDPESFWKKQTCDLVWRKPWDTFHDWKLPKATFFNGAKLNISESCLDRHLDTNARTRAAIVWEGEPGDTRTLTYFELHRE